MEIIRPDLPQECRIICISDIHANLKHFKALLEKCGYDKSSDYLFILGDILEKGEENLATLRFVKELCQNERVILIMGNNDIICDRMAFCDSKERFYERLYFRPHCTLTEMGKCVGIEDFDEDFEKKRKKVGNAFKDELMFVRTLPLAIETKDFIFVHAGIENRPDWESTSEKTALSQPWFLRIEHSSPKTVVCGHFPTYNYRRANNTCLPIFDSQRRMICIDGGASTKWAAQLNALIINYGRNGFDYETVYLPFGEEKTVIKSVRSDHSPVYVDWENYTLSIIEQQGDFLYVQIDQTKERGLIPKTLTDSWDGKLHGWIHLGAFLSAQEGEHFYVNGETEKYYFGIAQNGQVGFLPKSHIQ